MSKRYVLVKADGEGPKPCAFFVSAAGCRNGAGCKFLHGDEPTAGRLAAKSTPAVPATKVAAVGAEQRRSLPPPAAPITSVAKDEEEKKKKKKEKRKAKKEKVAAEAVAASPSPAPSPPVAAAPVVVALPPPASPSPLAPTSIPAVAAAAAVPASVLTAAEQVLSPTQAKKQAFREKAARKAAAAAARGAAAGVASPVGATPTAAAAAAPALAVPSSSAAPVPAAPDLAVVIAPTAAVGTAVPVAAKKKKKRKNKKGAAAEAAAAAAVGAPGPPSTVPQTATAVPSGTSGVRPGPPPPVFHPMPPMSTPAVGNVTPAVPAQDRSSKKVCSFYNKKKGCQIGALCPFLHAGVEGGGFGGTRGHARPLTATAMAEPVPLSGPTATTPAMNSMPASSTPFVQEQIRLHQQAASTNGVAAASSMNAVATSQPLALGETVLYSPGAAPPTVHVHAVPPVSPPLSSTAVAVTSDVDGARKTRKRGRSEPVALDASYASSVAGAGAGGLLDGLPVSPFVMSGVSSAATTAAPVGISHAKADPWQMLVERTRSHPKFKKSYNFETDASWIEGAPCGETCAGLPQVVALDCEMCMTEDPVTKIRNGKALVRLSISRGEDGLTLLDTLVRPVHPVVEWRTDIHGVTPQHLEGVLFTHSHAQAALARICCQHTVMIGHALNNDLEALKMKHERVVDTSFLFEGSDKKFSTPSLKDVAKAALGRDIQGGSHDSVTDAKCTLDVAKYVLERKNEMLPPVTRTKKVRRDGGMGSGGQHRDKRRKGENGITKAEARKEKEERALMVHRLPPGTTQQQLLRVMEKKTHAIATEVEPIEFSGSTGKTQVIYPTRAAADIAFNGISSNAQEDTSGRLQKKIYTSEDGKKYIAVRHALIMKDDPEEGIEQGGQGLEAVLTTSDSTLESSSEED